jgi:hypothetical protein
MAPRSAASVLLRLFWMLVGNAALFISGALIFTEGRGGVSWRDVLFGAIVVALIFSRWADIRWYDGQTADGEPADMVHYRKYVRNLVLIAGLAWGAIHASAML